MNKNKFLLQLVVTCSILISKTYGQRITGNEKIDHDIPGELTEFQDFNDFVDLSTGKIHPTIGLFSLEGINLKHDISLTYNSASNRVDAINGELGMGWTLNVGGYITRKVRGVPDESTVFTSIPSSADETECLNYREDGQIQAEQCFFNKGYFDMGVQGKAHRKGYLDYHVKNCVGSICDLTFLYGDRDESYTYGELIDDFFCKPIISQTYPRSGTIGGSEWWS
ncbi:hypothetical protein LV716_13845 [Flagellimonas sp. HMM57]|uniref:hypothetical protein n=1 Tax=unclassified Flagellimonas TaxID=2644544 RepID=UPI0013D220BC|nr:MULTISPECIES: hypothetical protein [unclassified Flagellimonas]UII75330.1 hypothetical protein LV716_13845 [Flagellimonas sp. HMM57]